MNKKSKISINIIGPIGSGKTTLIKALENRLLKDFKSNELLIQKETPTVIPSLKEILKNFYHDGKNWSYPLQKIISEYQASFINKLKSKSYKVSISDAAWSSLPYSYSFYRQGLMSVSNFNKIKKAYIHYPFNVLIVLNPSDDICIKNVKHRNAEISKSDISKSQPLVKKDFLLHQIQDFKEYLPKYVNYFVKDNKSIEVIEINNKLPKNNTKLFDKFIEDLYQKIIKE